MKYTYVTLSKMVGSNRLSIVARHETELSAIPEFKKLINQFGIGKISCDCDL